MLNILLSILLSNRALGQNSFEGTNFPKDITGNLRLHSLEIINNELYATTGNGIYKYAEDSKTWTCWQLEGYEVLDFKLRGEELVAVIVPQNTPTDKASSMTRFIRKNTHGTNIDDCTDPKMGNVQNGVQYTNICRLAQNPSQPNQLAIETWPGMWMSEDFGKTWLFKTDEGISGGNPNCFFGWHPYLSQCILFNQ